MESNISFSFTPSQVFETPATLNLGSPIPVNRENPSEGFQFSFHEGSRDEFKGSWEPSPLPFQEKSIKESLVVNELMNLQSQIQMINSKLDKNIQILKEKEKKNNELKQILDSQKLKSTNPTDASFSESYCSCSEYCKFQ